MKRRTFWGKPVTLLTGAAAILAVLAGVLYLNRGRLQEWFFRPTGSSLEQGVEQAEDIETVAGNLTVPWEVAFLPGGDLLVTERSGTLRRIGQNQQSFPIEGVQHAGEGGLLGLALHPDFQGNRSIYLYLTTRSGNGLINRIERYRLDADRLSNKQTIIANIPGANYHDGGRIAFGPDGYLYVTTGDAGNESAAQDIGSLAGKILRVGDDGSVPPDNPFGNAVYSFGHRNPQGLAWDNQGRLWATEHGRSGRASGYDELNRIEKGKNYGWPVIQGDETRPGMERPVAHSGPDETWAPAGMAFWDGSLFFGGLRGESLYEAAINRDGTVALRVHFREQFGRLRTVALSPNQRLLITTSNTDGRGSTFPDDDKVLSVDPWIFRQ